MYWFKHDADATTDAKIKKLIMKYGAEGYAIYFHCIELIVGNISEMNVTFELEHDAEIIADNLKIQGTADLSAIDRVNLIMKYIISLGLFEESNGHIFCYKLLKRLDCSMTSNVKMRKMIAEAKENHDEVMISHDVVMINPDSVMQDKIRIDKIRKEEKKSAPDKPAMPQKHKHGEYHHVFLTDEEYQRLKSEWGTEELNRMIRILDEGIETKGYKYKNHNLALRKWKANEKNAPDKPKTKQVTWMQCDHCKTAFSIYDRCPKCGKEGKIVSGLEYPENYNLQQKTSDTS